MASTKVEIANLTLSHLGESKPVTNIDTPSTPNEIHLSRFYPVALEICFKAHTWKFANKKALLVLHDVDNLDGPLNGEWLFAYDAPTDIARLNKVLPEGASKNEPSADFDRYNWLPDQVTPSSTDTTAETVTFSAAHGLVSGMRVTVSASVGGLVAGTVYYVHASSTTVLSFHTTLAAALAGTSKVNLTANITSAIVPYVVPLIFTNIGGTTSTANVYADYTALLTDITLYPEDFILALSYKLASLVAGPIIKGKSGITLAGATGAAYQAAIANAITSDARQGQNSDIYKDHKPSWVSNR